MKNNRMKKYIIILLVFILIFLVIFDINNIKSLRKRNKNINSKNTKSVETIQRKKVKYGYILEQLNKCSDKFMLDKINKENSNDDYINTAIQYNGKMDELINGLNELKNKEILKNINEIKILKKEDDNHYSQIDADFYKQVSDFQR